MTTADIIDSINALTPADIATAASSLTTPTILSLTPGYNRY